MALEHLTRIESVSGSEDSSVIYINDDGLEIKAIPSFRQYLRERGYSYDTIKRYEGAATRFVDYLIECGVFGKPSSPSQISDAISAYPMLLRDGATFKHPKFKQLGAYASAINMPFGLARNSMLPTIAGVNQFLRCCRDVAERAADEIKQAGGQVDLSDLKLTFKSIEGTQPWSDRERERFRQETMLGGVVRVKEKLSRPKGLRSPIRNGKQIELENKDFPLECLARLLEHAPTSRERAIWCLKAGGGLRIHEVLNIRLSDLDVKTRKVWVHDPEGRRFSRNITRGERIRFKGRKVSRVYFFEPLGSIFWSYLEDYLRNEFTPTDTHDYLFQKLDGVGRGAPLNQASDTAIQKPFKRAVIKAGISGPEEAPDHVWTLHSLRHTYGVYMLNYLPQPTGFGLRLTEVQMLMGHASTASTEVYARHDRLIVEAKVQVADEIVFAGADSASYALSYLPKAIASRLRNEADRIEACLRSGEHDCFKPSRSTDLNQTTIN
jgi:integrase